MISSGLRGLEIKLMNLGNLSLSGLEFRGLEFNGI